MNIGILPQFGEKRKTGIGKVAQATYEKLLELGGNNQYLYIDNIHGNAKDSNLQCMYDSAEIMPLDFFLVGQEIDIVHSFIHPFSVNCKKCGTILTIHDIRPIVHPEWATKVLREYFENPIKKCAQSVDWIVADSEYSKKDVVERWGISESKIKVVYPGIYPEDKFARIGIKINDDRICSNEYILSVSALDLNKNQSGLIKAYIMFRKKYPDVKIKLVLVGPIRDNEEICQLLSRNQEVAKDIVYTGYVSDDELVWLYRNAYVFMYPSFFEGFGLPILEAMSVGRAVICSNTTSMPEVGGDAVEYCDPYNIETMVGAIEKVVLSASRKAELEELAVVQAAKFSYEKAAKELVKIYSISNR